MSTSLAGQLVDPRDPRKMRYPISELLCEPWYALMLGYENQDDFDRLAYDPAMRMAASFAVGGDLLGYSFFGASDARQVDSEFDTGSKEFKNGLLRLREEIGRHIESRVAARSRQSFAIDSGVRTTRPIDDDDDPLSCSLDGLVVINPYDDTTLQRLVDILRSHYRTEVGA